jgi:hypothetical protein
MTMPEVPGLVGDVKTLLGAVKPVPGSALTFRMPVNNPSGGISRPAIPRVAGNEIPPEGISEVTLIPFYKASDIRYTAYWNVFTPSEWEKKRADRAAAAARQGSLPSRTIDRVEVGEDGAEKAHGYEGPGAAVADFDGRMGREASGTAWFSVALAVRADAPLSLYCLYREGKRRVFDVLVDGQRIATETLPYHPTELLDMEYPIPETLTRGRTRVVVRFQPQEQASTAQVFEVRVVTRAR